MTNEEAKELYQRAMARAEASDFAGALALFDELDAARPNSRHVTYQRARCLLELKRATEVQECLRKLEGKMEEDRLEEMRAKLAALRAASAPPARASSGVAAAEASNVLVIESVFPVSTDQTTVTGHVQSGIFRAGDTLTIVTPDGMPLLAPIERIGTAETPLNLVRAGQRAVMLLRVEPHHVVPGSSATSVGQEESYAKTMVVSSERSGAGPANVAPELVEAERLVKRGKHEEARNALEAYVGRDSGSCFAYRLLARVYLDAAPPLHDARRSLDSIRKAYELGGAQDPVVIDTLAEALAANGEAEQGLRFLERLYEGDLAVEARMALAQRIHDYRAQHELGHVWQFADNYGEVLLESSDPKEIVKAVTRGMVPKDGKCRRDRIGEWRTIETALGAEFPEIAALYKPAAPVNRALLFVVAGVIVVLIALALIWVLQ